MTARTLLTLFLVGCAPSYRGLDGRMIRAPLRVGFTDRGTVVVDSTGGAMRVIVELQVDVTPGTPDRRALPAVALRVGGSHPVGPSRLQRDAPVCRRFTGGPNTPGEPGRDTGMQPRGTYAPACSVWLRAEFSAPEGLFDDSVLVVIGAAAAPVRWRRP